MNPNLTTSYMALQTERERLHGLAERGWLAEQVPASNHRSVIGTTRLYVGVVLVAIGERLQAAPAGTSAPVAMKS